MQEEPGYLGRLMPRLKAKSSCEKSIFSELGTSYQGQDVVLAHAELACVAITSEPQIQELQDIARLSTCNQQETVIVNDTSS